MKIGEAIKKLDELKHNAFSKGEKIDWLSTVDGMVKKLIIDTHQGAEDVVYTGYSEDMADGNADDICLLVPAPFDQLYLWWLEAQVDLHNGEYDKYNNSITLFNTAFLAYADAYNREHMPLGAKSNFF